MAAGLRQVAGPARPGGRDGGDDPAALRARDRAGAGSPRRDRLHLRVPAQRHRRRRRPLPEVGQRGAAARRQRGARVEHPASPQILGKAVEKAGLPRRGDPGRRAPPTAPAVMAMLTLDRYLDLIIPRGGEEFVRAGHGARDGAGAQARQAALPPLRRRRRRPRHGAWRSPSTPRRSGVSVCNALETLLVHATIARRVAAPARRAAGRGRRRGARLTSGRGPSCPARAAAEAADWDAEYLDYILAVRVVDGPRRGDGAHPPPRLGAGRGHRHPRPAPRAPLHPARWTPAAVLVNASTRLRRRQPVRDGRGDRASPPRGCTRGARWGCGS